MYLFLTQTKEHWDMTTTNRFGQAIIKLYHAFHNDTLIPECNMQCAVGNILNNTDSWKHFSDSHGCLQLNYVGLVNENLGRRFQGFKPSELLQIEAVFLSACGYQLPLHHKNRQPKNNLNKDVLFNGLTALVALLCELDKVPNVLNCSELFNHQIASEFAA